MMIVIMIVIFWINIFDLILAKKLLLNIDPLSIRVDPKYYRLCWDQIDTEKLDYLNAIYPPSKPILLTVFSDQHQSNRTFCVEKVDTFSIYTVKIPLKFGSKIESLEILVNFSVKLSPAWDIIRTQVVPNGIHFHLNSQFAGMLKIFPVCRIILLFTTSKSKDMIQFEMDSHSTNNRFITLENGSKYSIYYSCHRFAFMHTSTLISLETGTTFSKEKTLPLKPFIRIPFRKFIVALWKHPVNVPNSYVIVISDGNDRCFKKFRLMKKDFIKPNQDPEFKERSCKFKIEEVDLGYYDGSPNGTISVVLNMGTGIKLDSKYKFSIFWKDLNQEIQENFIFFTFFPNENSAKVNPNFFKADLEPYDDLRNQHSNFNQILMSENHADPITENHINASGYNDALILPSVLEGSPINIQVIQSETLNNMVKKCNSSRECRRGYFPFFYSLFTIRHIEDLITEIIEIPRTDVRTARFKDLELKANNETSTFRVSWTREHPIETITPSSYVLEIKSVSPEKCFLACIIKCKTCNEVYKKTSYKNNLESISKIISNCNQKQEMENNFNALDSRVSFETSELPTSTRLVGSLYAIKFQSIIGPLVSKPSILPDSKKSQVLEASWKIAIIILIVGFVTILLILFIGLMFGFRKNIKNITNDIRLKDKVFSDYSDEDNSNKYEEGE